MLHLYDIKALRLTFNLSRRGPYPYPLMYIIFLEKVHLSIHEWGPFDIPTERLN